MSVYVSYACTYTALSFSSSLSFHHSIFLILAVSLSLSPSLSLSLAPSLSLSLFYLSHRRCLSLSLFLAISPKKEEERSEFTSELRAVDVLEKLTADELTLWLGRGGSGRRVSGLGFRV